MCFVKKNRGFSGIFISVSKLFLAFLSVLIFMVLTSESNANQSSRGSSRKSRELANHVFSDEDGSFEILLPQDWVPQHAFANRNIEWAVNSIRNISQIWVFSLPFQIEINERNFDERIGELVTMVKKLYPEFEVFDSKIVGREPFRLHIEGSWNLDSKPVKVAIEVFPVRRKTVVLILMSQISGRKKFREICDMVINGINVREKPIPVKSLKTIEKVIDGMKIAFQDEVENGWREALTEEIEFLKTKMVRDGLYEEVEGLNAEVVLVKPSLKDFSPTLTLRSVEGVIPVNNENSGKFELFLKSFNQTMGMGMEIHKISMNAFGGVNSFASEGVIKRMDFDVKVRQFFVPAKNRTLIFTYSESVSENQSKTESNDFSVSLPVKITIHPLLVSSKKKDVPKKQNETVKRNLNYIKKIKMGGIIVASILLIVIIILILHRLRKTAFFRR